MTTMLWRPEGLSKVWDGSRASSSFIRVTSLRGDVRNASVVAMCYPVSYAGMFHGLTSLTLVRHRSASGHNLIILVIHDRTIQTNVAYVYRAVVWPSFRKLS